MLKAGALDEVAALASRKLDPLLPAMKAHGVPALIRHLAGEITLEEAAVIGRADTRHYAKRQFTWFRHQLPEFEWMRPEEAGHGCSPDERASPDMTRPISRAIRRYRGNYSPNAAEPR